jgi:hypothetical protein
MASNDQQSTLINSLFSILSDILYIILYVVLYIILVLFKIILSSNLDLPPLFFNTLFNIAKLLNKVFVEKIQSPFGFKKIKSPLENIDDLLLPKYKKKKN